MSFGFPGSLLNLTGKGALAQDVAALVKGGVEAFGGIDTVANDAAWAGRPGTRCSDWKLITSKPPNEG